MEIGTRLGRYEIVGFLGAGGMGEVYVGHDSSLNRNVAIKVLPESLRGDPARLSRLRREARLLGSLSHRNIATLHGLEEEEGIAFLVLQLIDGQTLAEHLKQGPMPPRVALQVAVQVASGLSAAHARRIIHRDLKPSNVMLSPEGEVKLLDFGLARLDSAPDSDTDTASDSDKTAPGHRAGTLAYMSPEQIHGLDVDHRSDIWAFGCVLYEALAGRHPFAAATSSDLTAAILTRDPEWDSLQGSPAKIRDLVRRCLKKNRDDRLHHITDARLEIQEVLEEDPDAQPPTVFTTPSVRWTVIGAVALAATLAAALVSVVLKTREKTAKDDALSESVRTFPIELGGSLAFGIDYPASVVISRKGDQVAFVAESAGKQQIYVRPMDEMTAHPLAGTDGAQQPFFSPDGRWLGFFAEGKLKKISLRGGAPFVLSAAQHGMGGAWSSEGWIVFAPSDSEGLRRVSEGGGEGEAFSDVNLKAGEQAHWNPSLLADERTVLFTVYTGGRNTESRLAVQGPGERTHRVILQGGGPGRMLPPHWLIYGRGRELLAAQFDPVACAITGTPFRVLEGVQDTPSVGSPIFDVSDQGALVYAPATIKGYEGRIVWLDQAGQAQAEIATGHAFAAPRLAPDGSRVAYHFADPDFNVWVKDLGRDTRLRLTQDPGWDAFPVWSPEGSRIAFSSAREGSRTLFLQSADGSGSAERLLAPGNPRWPTSWSPNGAWLAYQEEDPQTGMDVSLLDMEGRRVRPLLRTPFNEAWPRFSPDGEWLAYHSNESGSPEVYICRLDKPNRRFQVSTGGGIVPIWSSRGDRIFYTRGTRLMAAEVRLAGSPKIGRPRALFKTDGLEVNDVNAAGDRFLAVDAPVSMPISRFSLIEGWGHVVARLAETR